MELRSDEIGAVAYSRIPSTAKGIHLVYGWDENVLVSGFPQILLPYGGLTIRPPLVDMSWTYSLS